MTTLRQFTCDDLFRFNGINLDPLTEMYGLSFYLQVSRNTIFFCLIFCIFTLQYMARWPEYFQVAESPAGDLMGYIMGKSEGMNENWHGHVTAVTVGPEHRRLGLANRLMEGLEEISDGKNCYFVDLFVRVSNKIAINFYRKLGYTVYRTVLQYYSGDNDEDAYDMRKALTMDVEGKSVVPLPAPVHIDDQSAGFWD